MELFGAKLQYEAALKYYKGVPSKGYGKNRSKAFKLFKEAAEAGLVEAMFQLGRYYYFPILDYEKAFNYFLYTADKEDDSDIYTNLACAKVTQMYEKGLGTEINLEKAKYYQEKYMRGLQLLMAK